MKIAVTGGKGGTGKSTVAVNLAVALAMKGKSVTLVDCDVDCPNDHLILGSELQEERIVYSFVPRIDTEKCVKCGKCAEVCMENALAMVKGGFPRLFDKICSGCEACKLACPENAIVEDKKLLGGTYETEKLGVKLVTGELKPSEPLSVGVVNAAKERGLEVGKDSDVIIIDTAAGTHCDVVRALYGCEKAFVVTEPTPFGLHDLNAIQDILEKLGIENSIVLNRSDIAEAKKLENTVLELPYSNKMAKCYVDATPIVEKHPEHEISKKFFELTEVLK